MKKIDLNFKLKDLDGNDIEDANKLFAKALMTEKTGDPVKYFGWAMKLNVGEILEVDDSDLIKMKEVSKNSESLTMLGKAQFLIYFETIR